MQANATARSMKPTGNEHTELSGNVLIEIGAAIALCGKKIILLVEKAWRCRPTCMTSTAANSRATSWNTIRR